MADPGQSPLTAAGLPASYGQRHPSSGPANLADILERVLDKGIVIAGDIRINLLEIELLTIHIRLLIASVDRAREMGINWWEGDPTLSRGASDLENENRELRDRLDRLERAIGAGDGDGDRNEGIAQRTRSGQRSPGGRT
jgi:hypothetical protein